MIYWSKKLAAADIAARARSLKYAALKEYRWQVETGGIQIDGFGRFATTAESQSKISNARVSVMEGMIQQPVVWSVNGAWVDLSAEQITAVGAAVATHVQACFDAQRAVEGQMDALSDLTDFDVQAAFDAAYAERTA